MYKRMLALGLTMMLLCALVCGCGQKDTGDTAPGNQTTPTTEGTAPSTEETKEKTTEDPTEEMTQEQTEDSTGETLEWAPAAPSGSLAPTEPDEGTTKPTTDSDKTEPTTEAEQSEAEKNGCGEDVTPWG